MKTDNCDFKNFVREVAYLIIIITMLNFVH